MPYNSLSTGRKTVGASEVQLVTDSSVLADKGLLVYADVANTGIIYVGNTGVTADSADATDGFPIDAGNAVLVPVRHPYTVYAISDTASQKVWWMVV